jgi:hypothetical protein
MAHSRTLSLLIGAVLLLPCVSANAAFQRKQLDDLSESFWTWRATEQPFTNDDIPRIERAADFEVNWSPAAVKKYQTQIVDFEKQWRAIDITGASVADQIDYRLVGSAIARVYWELDVFPMWKENPFYYVDQSLGSVYAALLPKPPITPAREAIILSRLEHMPVVLEAGKANLTDIRAPYVRATLSELKQVEMRMQRFHDGLLPVLSAANKPRFEKAEAVAVKALIDYRAWVSALPVGKLQEKTAVGREDYIWFLRNVALMKYSPEDMLRMGKQEWERSVAFETLAQAASTGVPEVPFYGTMEKQLTAEKENELAIRKYMVTHGVLSDPAEVKHYYYLPTPPYIAPLGFMGVTDDLTGPSRLEEDGTSYKGMPRPTTNFWGSITGRDTRPLTLHEGSVGHYFQMAWSWRHPDPIRRHYYDSESNEGIGFYAEEMALQAGLFDDSPHMKEAIYGMMRLRALRVEVDVKLALDQFTLEQAADYLTNVVPMDRGTATSEAIMFASTPGQAITYQIGKLDIIRMMSDARLKQGSAFRLQTFHDFVWLNGNLPFSLQRWEMLGDPADVPPVAASFASGHPSVK